MTSIHTLILLIAGLLPLSLVSAQSFGPRRREVCSDSKPECDAWRLTGCNDWKNALCPLSCRLCGPDMGKKLGPDCKDYSLASCPLVATKMACDTYASTLLWNCPISCRSCGSNIDCRNSDIRCNIWAGLAQCSQNPVYMNRVCPRACNQCQGGTTPDCRNYEEDNYCEWWANTGECCRNPSFMLYRCAKSCKVCGTGKQCLDRRSDCPKLAALGKCQSDKATMDFQCPATCNICQDPSGNTAQCKDLDFNCAIWASGGECTANPGYMSIYCKRSCGICTA